MKESDKKTIAKAIAILTGIIATLIAFIPFYLSLGETHGMGVIVFSLVGLMFTVMIWAGICYVIKGINLEKKSDIHILNTIGIFMFLGAPFMVLLCYSNRIIPFVYGLIILLIGLSTIIESKSKRDDRFLIDSRGIIVADIVYFCILYLVVRTTGF